MPETRGFPRLLPRRGAKVIVSFGQPITDRIRPLIDEWRRIASSQGGGTVGIAGDWEREGKSPNGHTQRRVREAGRLADGAERTLRIKICELLQDSVQKLGATIEREEGRFERGDWCQSTQTAQRS